MNGSSDSSHLSPTNLNHNTDTHTHTHTHHKATHSPNPLQTVPHAAHKMRPCLKIDGVTSIELKCAECLKKQYIYMQTKHVNAKI